MNKGITLYVAMIIMGTILFVAVGAVTLAARQNIVSYSAKESQEAFYAADTGIERVLLGQGNPLPATGQIDYGSLFADYEVQVIDPSDPDCEADNFCLRSFGKFEGVTRAIEIER